MNKEFVPYEQSLELKELGFDEPCFGKFYFNQLEIGGNWCNNDFKEDPDIFISSPLYQQAFRWFRKNYDIHSNVNLYHFHENTYCFNVVTKTIPHYLAKFTHFHSYEEAELECLKKLIEIVKNK